MNCAAAEPLKVMISGAPASGKGTQCELIVQKVIEINISNLTRRKSYQLLERTKKCFV